MRPVLFFLLTFPLAAQQPDGARGAAIYSSQCAICHGRQGEGGRGPSLARARLRHAPSDESLMRLIRAGLPGGGMPGTWLNDFELRDVAAHVRSLGRFPRPPVAGDAARGETVYLKAGCAKCHTLRGEGGAFGPDLTGIGSRRNAGHLRASVLDPAADVPAGFVLIHADKITGARVNEDTFSVQIRDASGKLHSFWKSALTSLRKEPGKTAMPSYRGTLQGEDLDNLIAYLASQEDLP